MKRLVLEIEFAEFYAEDIETDEDAEVALALASETVVVVFSGHEGDEPRPVLRSLEGRITRYSARASVRPNETR